MLRTEGERSAQPLGKVALRGAAWSALSTVILRLGSLTFGIVLARILTPGEFGVYAIALTVQGIIMTVADLGLSADLIRSNDPGRIAPTVASLALASGTLIAVTTAVWSRSLAEALGDQSASAAIAVLALSLFLAGLGVVPYALLSREFRQRALFIVSVVDFTVSVTVTLILLHQGLGVMALAWGRVCAQVVATCAQFVFAGVRPRFGIDRRVISGVLAFGIPIAAANLLSWTLLNVDNVVLVRVAGATALGYYVLAFNLSGWPMSALSQVVRSMVLPYFSRIDDDATLGRVTAIAWAGALPAGSLLAVLSGPLIHVLYGSRWTPAAGVLAALGMYGSLRVVFDVFAGYLYAKGRSMIVLVIQIVWLVALCPSLVWSIRNYGIIGAGWAHVAVAVVLILPLYLHAISRRGPSISSLLRACCWPTFAMVPTALAAAVVNGVMPGQWWRLLGGLGAAALTYGILVAPWIKRQLRVALSKRPITAMAVGTS